ncbi:hypothetical protein BRD17_00135 [Halobacteriales archaeon SW_7_68_16]|nr:MAG: hypothetical protein BRD17_00135 [Halobacteriales archaeon SW_7_68_16]
MGNTRRSFETLDRAIGAIASDDPEQRLAAVEGIGARMKIEAPADDRPPVARMALTRLWVRGFGLPGDRSRERVRSTFQHRVDSLRALAVDDDPDSRATARRALAVTGDPTAAETVRAGTTDDAATVRAATARTLARLGTDEVLADLADLADLVGDPDPDIHRAVVASAADLGAGGLSLCRDLVDDRDPSIRLHTVRSLAAIGCETALDFLAEVAVDDESPDVRAAAASAIR